MSRESSRSEREAFRATGGDPRWNVGPDRQDSWGTMFSAMSLNSNGSEIGTPPQDRRGQSLLQIPSAGRLEPSLGLQSYATPIGDQLGLPPRAASSRSRPPESLSAFLDRTLSDIGPLTPLARTGDGQGSDRYTVDRRHALMNRTVSGRILAPSPHPLGDHFDPLSSTTFQPPQRPISRRSSVLDGPGLERRPPPMAHNGGIVQPRTILQRDAPPSPQPPGTIAIHIAIYEGRAWNSDKFDQEAVTRRNVSIVAQSSPNSTMFREFCCIPAPLKAREMGRRHIRFYSTPEIPHPRTASPGLLAMYFVGWVPAVEGMFLDAAMKDWRSKIRSDWTLFTWIDHYLDHLIARRYLTDARKMTVLALQERALNCPWAGSMPNNHGCFPDLFRAQPQH